MGIGLELADAEPSGDGNRVFLVRISQQSQRGGLRGEFVSGQEPKLGEPTERIPCGRTLGQQRGRGTTEAQHNGKREAFHVIWFLPWIVCLSDVL